MRMASLILDDYVHKKTASGARPVFRTPVQASQKNWAAVEWPVVREKDPVTKRPKPTGQGSVIYRFMVNHERVRNLPGYKTFKDSLYDDPSPPTATETACTAADGLLVTLPTLQARCAEDQFAGLNLWETGCRRYNAMVAARDTAPVLTEKYRQIKAERSGLRSDFGQEEFLFSPV